MLETACSLGVMSHLLANLVVVSSTAIPLHSLQCQGELISTACNFVPIGEGLGNKALVSWRLLQIFWYLYHYILQQYFPALHVWWYWWWRCQPACYVWYEPRSGRRVWRDVTEINGATLVTWLLPLTIFWHSGVSVRAVHTSRHFHSIQRRPLLSPQR